MRAVINVHAYVLAMHSSSVAETMGSVVASRIRSHLRLKQSRHTSSLTLVLRPASCCFEAMPRAANITGSGVWFQPMLLSVEDIKVYNGIYTISIP